MIGRLLALLLFCLKEATSEPCPDGSVWEDKKWTSGDLTKWNINGAAFGSDVTDANAWLTYKMTNKVTDARIISPQSYLFGSNDAPLSFAVTFRIEAGQDFPDIATQLAWISGGRFNVPPLMVELSPNPTYAPYDGATKNRLTVVQYDCGDSCTPVPSSSFLDTTIHPQILKQSKDDTFGLTTYFSDGFGFTCGTKDAPGKIYTVVGRLSSTAFTIFGNADGEASIPILSYGFLVPGKPQLNFMVAAHHNNQDGDPPAGMSVSTVSLKGCKVLTQADKDAATQKQKDTDALQAKDMAGSLAAASSNAQVAVTSSTLSSVPPAVTSSAPTSLVGTTKPPANSDLLSSTSITSAANVAGSGINGNSVLTSSTLITNTAVSTKKIKTVIATADQKQAATESPNPSKGSQVSSSAWKIRARMVLCMSFILVVVLL